MKRATKHPKSTRVKPLGPQPPDGIRHPVRPQPDLPIARPPEHTVSSCGCVLSSGCPYHASVKDTPAQLKRLREYLRNRPAPRNG